MIKILYNILSVFCLTSLFSCGYLKKNNDVEIRLVDVNGKSRQLTTRIPDLNLKALAQQGKLYSATQDMVAINNSHKKFKANNSNLIRDESYNQSNSYNQNNDLKTTQQDKNNDDFGSFSSQTISQTFNSNQKLDPKKSVKQNNTKEVEYDLSSTKADQKKQAKKPTKKTTRSVFGKNTKKTANKSTKSATNAKNKGIFIQVGSFSKRSNAEKFLKYMNKFNPGEIQTVKTRSGKVHRVVLGPMPSIGKANNTIGDIKRSGHDAILLVNN